jgi:hypothetical protein
VVTECSKPVGAAVERLCLKSQDSDLEEVSTATR